MYDFIYVLKYRQISVQVYTQAPRGIIYRLYTPTIQVGMQSVLKSKSKPHAEQAMDANKKPNVAGIARK